MDCKKIQTEVELLMKETEELIETGEYEKAVIKSKEVQTKQRITMIVLAYLGLEMGIFLQKYNILTQLIPGLDKN